MPRQLSQRCSTLCTEGGGNTHEEAGCILSLLCLLSLPVSAAYIPESSVTENRDGRQLIIKTYQLSPEDDPSELVDEPFDLEGYHYEHLETVKEDQTFHDSNYREFPWFRGSKFYVLFYFFCSEISLPPK